MGKNIIIETDGTAHTYNGVKQIKTQNPQGSDDVWVPMEDAQTAEKTISKNGRYVASKEGYYGYSKVIVNSKGVTTGAKPDGRKYSVTTDDDGYINEMVLADNIRIIKPPNKLNYRHGEVINLTGIKVIAYVHNELWAILAEISGRVPAEYADSIIPISELEVVPAQVDASKGTTQKVTLIWQRYDDFEDLKTTFNISVTR